MCSKFISWGWKEKCMNASLLCYYYTKKRIHLVSFTLLVLSLPCIHVLFDRVKDAALVQVVELEYCRLLKRKPKLDLRVRRIVSSPMWDWTTCMFQCRQCIYLLKHFSHMHNSNTGSPSQQFRIYVTCCYWSVWILRT